MSRRKKAAPCGSTRLGHRIGHMLGINGLMECERNGGVLLGGIKTVGIDIGGEFSFPRGHAKTDYMTEILKYHAKKGSDNMTNEIKRHYIADEKLGGIEREYTESDRYASAGDYIVGTLSGTIYAVDSVSSTGTCFSRSTVIAHKGVYKTLSSTDIIRHSDERYRLVDRRAKVGDKIIVIGAWYSEDAYDNGSILTVNKVSSDGIYSDCARSDDDGLNSEGYLRESEYSVLETVIDEQDTCVTSEPADDAPDLIDLVIRLSRTVADLEKRAESAEQELSAMSDVFENHRDWTSYRIGNVRETANNADYKAGQALTTAELLADKPRCCRCY